MQHLADNEENYQLLFEITPLPIFLYDLHSFAIINANQTALEFYGYTRSEFLQCTLTDIVLPQDLPLVKARLADDPFYPRHKEIWQHRNKLGDLFDVELNAYTVQLGERLARLVIVNDVTARLAAEAQLREAQDYYKLLFEKSPLPAWVYDQHSLVFLDVNQAALEQYGYTREEFLAMSIHDIRPPEEVPRLLEAIAQRVPNDEISKVWRHRKKDGSLFDVEVSVYPITFRQREAVIVTAQDITARQQVELALRASEERYRTLYEKANDAIFAIDLQGNFTSINEAGEKYLGYTRAELLQMNAMQIIPPADLPQAEAIFQRIVNGETADNVYEVNSIAKDGRILPTEISATLIYQAGRAIGMQGIGRDLTRRRLLEEKLREAQKMEAIGRLSGRLAHDFNNLLTVVQGYTSLLMKRTAPADERFHLLEQIKLAGDSAASFTSQLLTLGRQQITQLEILDLNEIVIKMGNILRGALGEDIELGLLLDPDIGFIRADSTQLDHAIMNLVLNARDAMTKEGKLTIATTGLEIGTLRAFGHSHVPPGKYVRLSLHDTGTGMSTETQAHLFEPFFSTKEKGKGTGLGLFNVQKIVQQCHGYIVVQSTLGVGTTFHLYFPLIEGAELTPRQTTLRQEAVPGQGTILLVEDEIAVRKLVKEILSEGGYRVLEAGLGEEALALAAEHHQAIDLVLTDVRMPKMNGRVLAEKLRQEFALNRVLFMSGYADDSEVVRAVSAAHVPYLQKPFSADALIAKISEVLASSANDKP